MVPQKHNLKGKVKLITQVQSPIANKKGDWLDGPSGQNYTEEYSKEGFLLKRIARNDYNQPTLAVHYEYNSQSQVGAFWEETLESKPIWGAMGGRIAYEFDPIKNVYIKRDNRIIMGQPYHRRTESSIDSLNRIAIQREYKQDTLLVKEQNYRWDSNGSITHHAYRTRKQPEERINPTNKDLDRFLQNEFNVKFSEAEKKLLQKSLDSLTHRNDSLYAIQPEWSGDTINYKNAYDSRRRLVRQESFRANQMTEIVNFSYDTTATQIVRQTYDKAGNLISETTSRQHPIHKYILSDISRHKNGDKWEEQIYNYSASYTQPIYQHKFDDHGNWIEQKQVDSTGKQIGLALVRTIEYYP
ncbi:hypothetical protein GCM10028810_27350 [Spirosoma litoris]